jgi:nickel-dependent lactate racemase
LATDLTRWLALRVPRDHLRVTIVIPDDTRPIQPTRVLPPILAAIAEATDRRSSPIEAHILVGSGLHAPPCTAFLEEVAKSAAPFQGYRLLQVTWGVHDAAATEAAGRPLNAHVMDAHCNITVGVVEPHQYAGFSGGLKGLSLGCGATSTIAGLHSLDLLRQPGVQIGRVEDNPFRLSLEAVAAAHSAQTYVIALVPDPSTGDIAGMFAGPTDRAWKQAVALAQSLSLVPVSARFDFVVAEVPDTKNRNFYQASRALTYLALHPSPCIEPGGTLAIVAACPDGYGAGQGEKTFRTALRRGRARLLAELAGTLPTSDDMGGGAQRAYVLAQALDRFRCVLIGGPDLPEARAAGLVQAETLADAGLAGRGLIVDDPFIALPYHDEAQTDRLEQLT